MVLGPEAFNCGTQKKLIYPGKAPVEYVDGTKVYFHYRTLMNNDQTILDDSKKMDPNKPMEIIIGKKFKLEIWEKALKTMWIGETSRFSVVKELLYDYPVVSKQLREYYNYQPDCDKKDCANGHSHSKHAKQKNEARHHCCGFNLIEHGVGYPDLDALLKNPQPLDFILELIRVEQPGEYTKDAWALSEEEQIKIVPVLKESGNELFKKKMYKEAGEKYEEALGHLEQLMLREKPNDVEWIQYNEQKMPILLNFSMCKFNLGEFYSCIEHANTILEHQPFNVKALFRRAKAKAAVWSLDEAREDFNKCVELDESLKSEVQAQLDYVKGVEEKKKKEDLEKFKGKLFG